MNINHDINGKYLRSTGRDYKRIQTAVRKLRRQKLGRHLQSAKQQEKITQAQQVYIPIHVPNHSIHYYHAYQQVFTITQEITQLRLRVTAVEQQADERVAAGKRQANERVMTANRQANERVVAAKQAADLRVAAAKQDADERVAAAKQEADEAKKRERQALKKKEATSKTLESVKQLLRDVRVSRDQFRHDAEEAKKNERQAIRRASTAETRAMAIAKKQVHKRVMAVEHRLDEASERERQAVKKCESMSSAVQPVPEKQKKFASHTWLAVARVLGIEGENLKRVSRASKHMHDTKSSNWEETVTKNTELIYKLRSVGKLLTTCLFECVRVQGSTVPVEKVVQVIFPLGDNDIRGGMALQDIRKAVHSALAERRISDAKMLLTLAISSFGEKANLETMKKYFTHVEPIVPGCKVTFLTPDNSPISANKKIERRNYSYLSKAVTRGTVMCMMANGKEIKVRHHVPGV